MKQEDKKEYNSITAVYNNELKGEKIIKKIIKTMFPNYKNGIFFKKPNGWEDLGEVETKIIRLSNDKQLEEIEEVHTFCNTKAKIGRENGELFKFCPRCLVKLTYEKRKIYTDNN